MFPKNSDVLVLNFLFNTSAGRGKNFIFGYDITGAVLQGCLPESCCCSTLCIRGVLGATFKLGVLVARVYTR